MPLVGGLGAKSPQRPVNVLTSTKIMEKTADFLTKEPVLAMLLNRKSRMGGKGYESCNDPGRVQVAAFFI